MAFEIINMIGLTSVGLSVRVDSEMAAVGPGKQPTRDYTMYQLLNPAESYYSS